MTLPTHTLELVAHTDAHEGPVFAGDERALYFTSLPADDRAAIRRLDLASGRVETVVEDANRANGMTMDHQGRLVVCEQGGYETPARIARLNRETGRRETLAEAFHGRPLSSPNDIVVKRTARSGSPTRAMAGSRASARRRRSRTRSTASPRRRRAGPGAFDTQRARVLADEQMLYVGDSGPRHVNAFDAGGRRRFAETALPDGIKTDARAASTLLVVAGRAGLRLRRHARPRPDSGPATPSTSPPARPYRLFIAADAAMLTAEQGPQYETPSGPAAPSTRRGGGGAPRRRAKAGEPGPRVVIAVVDPGRARRAAAHAGRAGGVEPRGRRQGAHRGDLHPPEPRARAAGRHGRLGALALHGAGR